jgi:general secretion pathway protein K
MTARDQRGFALILTLVVAALLVALAVELIHGVAVDTSLHRNFVNLQQAGLLAESGANGTVALLREIRAAGRDATLQELLAAPRTFEDERGKVFITLEEEEGKLNLNAVTLPNGEPSVFHDRAWQRLLRLMTLPTGLHESLADWVDENDTPRPDGAESAWYRSLPAPYDSRNGRLETFGELGLVKGFSATVLDQLRPVATIYGAGGVININTAPPKLIEALDEEITEATAREIVARRRVKPFKNVGELAEIPGMERIVGRLAGWVGVRGNTYRLVSRAMVGETVRIVEAIVAIDGAQPTYHYWREY